MNSVTKELTLGFYNNEGVFTIPAKQGDTGRELKIELIENLEPFEISEETKASIRMLKADGKQIYNSDCCKIENNKVTVSLTSQMLAAPGIAECELLLIEGEIVITTCNFNIDVIASVHNDSQIESSYECDTLAKLFVEAKETIEKINVFEESATEKEQERSISENIRVTNETNRITNENLRECNEEQREFHFNDVKEKYENIIADTNIATENCIEATNKANHLNIYTQETEDEFKLFFTDREGVLSESQNLKNKLRLGTVESTDNYNQASASISGNFGNQVLNLTLPVGKPFKIQKIYSSVNDMISDFNSNDVLMGDFVIISSDIEDEDNAKLYVKTDSKWIFITDLSGAQGIQGMQGLQGKTGITPVFSIGSVTTGKEGSIASATITGTPENPVLNLTIPKGDKGTIDEISTDSIVNNYEVQSERTNITLGEKLSVSLGKIKKWFADLKAVAFSGNYQDLTNKPSSLPANGGNADTVDGYHAKNLMVYETNYYNGNIDTLTNTCTLFMQGATCTTIPKSPDKNESIYYGYLTHIRGLNNDWQYQLMKTLSGTLYFRQKKSNVWETAWTAANDNGNAKMVNGIKIYSSIKEIGSYSTISNVCKNMPLSSILVSYAFRNEYTDLPQSGSYWNLHIHKDFEGHCTINAVHFSGGKPGNNCYSHTDTTAGWEIVWKTNSVEGHTHNNIQGKGKLPATTSSVHGEGLSMGYVYNNGYPVPYGNVLRMGGEGDGELLIGWSGTTGEKAPAYIRSCRDSGSTWSDWDKIITESCLANNLTTTAAGYALDARQGKEINTRLDSMESTLSRFNRYPENYSIYYPEKDYTLDAVGTNQSYYGFLNLGKSQYADENLFEISKTDASSSSCTYPSIDNPTNYIMIKSEGLYQIDVHVTRKGTNGCKVWLYKKDGAGFPIAEFGCLGDSKTGNINIISYMSEGSRIYVVMKSAVTSGSISLSSVVGDGVTSGIFIKRIM